MRVPQRGRAILRKLSPHEPQQAFRPGDFVLTASDGGLARTLGWASASAINHAGIIIDPLGSVIEANPELLSGGRLYRLTTIADYLNAGKPCWIGYVELREGTRQAVVAYAEHLLHAHGATWSPGRFWIFVHALLSIAPRTALRRSALLRPLYELVDRHALVLREEHCYASSELVARALERGGFIWEHDPAQITPGDLYDRFRMDDTPVTLTPKFAGARRPRPGAARSASGPQRSATIMPFTP
ncbi:MAG TPA: hypothetical protein VE258_14225, partial [Ktedonobacterales bacterium]|nr:hypothetical protein [Ktedonobacterales bacterium]